MSTRGWSGRPPANPEEARERLMDAAVRCLQRFGFEKTAVADIAAEAGVTKPTIYSYFGTRDELLRAALQRAAEALADRILLSVQDFDDPAEQLVEALLICLREIPNEPGLAVSSRTEVEGFGMRGALRQEGIGLAAHLIEQIVRDPLDDLEEIAEVMIRWLLSLLVVDRPEPRDEDEIRSLLHRRMIPGLGLAPASRKA